MRQALPNACFLGFTGTPIDKKDRSTLQGETCGRGRGDRRHAAPETRKAVYMYA